MDGPELVPFVGVPASKSTEELYIENQNVMMPFWIFNEAMDMCQNRKVEECCRHLLVGLRKSCTLEVRRTFLRTLSRFIPGLQVEIGDMFKDVDIPDSPSLWAQILSDLTHKDFMDWTAVRFLVLGIDNDGLCPLEGIAADVATNGIEVGSLLTRLTDLELKTWGLELAICLLKKGADVKSLAQDDRENPAIAATRSAIRTGENTLFKHVMERSTETRSLIDSKDVDGNTPLHLVVKSGKTSSFSGEALLRLLLSYGASVIIRDAAGRLPIDYVKVKTSAHAALLKAPATCVKEKMKSLKEQGNRYKQDKDMQKALEMYREAISVGEAASGCDTSKDLCILHTNCSLVLHSMGQHQEALVSAQMALQNDGSWYKGYWMLGKCQKSLGRDMEAFDTYHTALKKAQIAKGSSVQVMFLVAFIQAIPNLVQQDYPYIKKVEDHLKIIHENLVQIINGLMKDKSLDALKVLVLGPEPTSSYGLNSLQQDYLTMNSGLTAKLQATEVILEPLLLVEQSWMGPLLVVLLKNGAKLSTLTSVPEDNFLHAAVNFCIRTENTILMEYLVSTECNGDDIKEAQDAEGRSLYHVVCESCPTGSSDISLSLSQLLILHKFNPILLNRRGETAIDRVQTGSKLHVLLSQAVQKAQSGTEAGPPRGRRGKGKSGQPQHDCTRCEEKLKRAIDLSKRKDVEPFVSAAVSLLSTAGQGKQHSRILKDCMDLIVEVLQNPSVTEIPPKLRELSPRQMKNILEKLAHSDHWSLLLLSVKMYGENKLPNRFGKNIPVTSVVVSDIPQALKQKVMTLLQRKGAKLCHENECEDTLQEVFKRKEYDLVLQMIDAGVNPSSLSLEPGDTPLHAALGVVFKTGNFSLLDKLLELYKSNGEKYANLDPKKVNQSGDTLLHTACRCKYNNHSQKAVEFLCNQQVPDDTLNKEGKMAIQYLTNRNDRRAQFLRVVGGTTPTLKSKSTEPQEKKQPSKDGTKKKHTMENGSQESSPDRVKDETDIRVKAVNLVSVAKSRERIKEILGERPDPQISMYREGKTKDRFGTSPSKVKADEGQAEAIAEQRMGSPRKENRTVAERMLEEEEKVDQEEMDEDEEVEEEVDINTITFDNMAWEVECTADVWKCLRNKHVPPELKRRAVCRIQYLAKGEWRPYLRKRINNVPPTLELYEAKLSKAARIIWEVAVAFSARCSEEADKRLDVNEGQDFAVKGGKIYSEIIRVWDIVFDHDNLYISIQNIIKSHSRGESCILKKKLKGVKDSQFEGGMTNRYPMPFAEQDDDLSLEAVRDMQQMLLYPPASANATEYHILKFYSFSTALVNIILQNIERKVDFPFRVTDEEHDIIKLRSKSPILLIGRSGTGKTTCCLYRLWTSFISYWVMARNVGEPFLPRAERFIEDKQYNDADGEVDNEEDNEENKEDLQAITATTECDAVEECPGEENECEEPEGSEYDHLHQVFVTKNPVLCSEVHKNFYEWCHAHAETKDHTQKETEDLPYRLQDIEDLSYPLFLTSKQLLLMLDASLDPPHFFDRNEDGSLGVRVQGWGAKDDLFSFSTLESDSDDEDVDDEDQDEELLDEDGNPIEQQAPARQQQKLDPRREVTYEVFAEEVWPKIVKKMSVNYHPSLVWTEIMSFIKGSFEALSKQNGHLSRDEYVELGRKRAPSFSGERDKVYELYKRYDHFKKQKFLFDESDLVQNIYRRLRAITVQPWVFHQLYVDETQDFTQAELCVLVRISQNPNDMFLTGDTAQGIMRGISFRFNDLRSLFFYARKSLHARGQIGTVNVPKQIYQLTHNYRSHAGIISLASAVLDLMVEFFPESFDRLQKDQGLFPGPRPILLESCSLGDLAILLQGNKRKTSHIEFGAHQAILVVNDSVKNNMPEELSHGIVLTIYESKGLEFDDVLLYNFFKDSQACKEWRVVTSFLERIANTVEENKNNDNLVTIDEEILKQSKRPRPLTFDPNQHKVLNSEMKHLYTALTRARVNVWIFDEDDEKRAPMFEYFKALKLVRCITQQEMDATGAMEDTMFAEKSTPEDWTKRGDEMMGRRLYEVAAKCYKMGNEETKEKIAVAHNQALKASRMKDNPKKMREEFVFAAEKFIKCGHDNKGALCLQKAKENEVAALAFEKCGQLVEAAKMYRQCKKHVDGSRCYEQLGTYHKAVAVLDNVELYDQAIDCLERYKLVVSEYEKKGQEIPQVLLQNKPGINFTVARLSFKAAKFYHKSKNESKMVEALERLPRVEDRLDFLKKRGYVEQAATILMSEGKTTEAARMMLHHGKAEKALQFAEMGDDQDVLGDCHYAQALACMSSKEEFNQDKIIGHLNSAKDAFTTMHKSNSVGVACLAVASIKLDIEIAKKALMSFKENEVGKLEALNLVVKLSSLDEEFDDIMTVIRGVDCLFAVMKALLKPTSTEEKFKAQLNLQFYGLHEKDVNTLIVYPKQKPRCVTVIPNFYRSKQEKKQQSVDKDRKWVCVKISIHLVAMLKTWISETRDSLRTHMSKRLQCKSHMEGEECFDEDYCPYLHEDYGRRTAFHALDALLWEVHLDSILQSGAKTIKTLSIQGMESEVKDLLKDITSLIEEDTQFDSCERLLDFLMPEHHHMRTITENVAVMSQLLSRLSFGKVHDQVERFLDYCWKFQDKKLPPMELMEKRSKSTDWFVRATLFASIFKLKLDVHNECHKLEGELMKCKPKWLNNRKKYALLAEFRTVECLGRKFCSAYSWLQKNPLKAIIEYAKFVKILSDRGRLSLFPKIPLFLFWQEVFVSVSFFNIAKLSSVSASFFVPATYLATIPFLNATFKSKNISIQELIHKSSDRRDNIKVVRDRFRQIVGVLCGQRMNLLRMIFTKKKDGSEIQYLQAERCLVLALVVLVNMGTFVPSEIENPLMSTVVNLSLPKDAPIRLRKTLEAMQSAQGYVDLVATLKELLLKREEEYLLTCHWKWDTQRGQEVQFRQLQRLDDFSHKFYVFDPENPLPGDEDLFQDEYEDELGLTKEEAQKRQEEHFQYERDLKRDKSAKKLQRFFKWLTFKNRLAIESGMFTGMCRAQEMKELLAPYEVNERICGVCGISFKSDELSMKDIPEELIEEDETAGQQSPSILEAETSTLSAAAKSLWSPGNQNTQFDAHKITSEHIQQTVQFQVFKHLHEEYFVHKVPEMRKFITKMRLKNQEFTAEHYQDQALDVSRLTSQMDDILASQRAILNTRNWEKATSLRDKVMRMYSDYTRVGPEIETKYKEYLETQKQTLENRNDVKPVKVLREDSQQEDWEPEILEVVDEPAPRRKEQQRRPKGGGGGGGRRRARDQPSGDIDQENGIGQEFNQKDPHPRFQRAQEFQELNQKYQENRHHVPN